MKFLLFATFTQLFYLFVTCDESIDKLLNLVEDEEQPINQIEYRLANDLLAKYPDQKEFMDKFVNHMKIMNSVFSKSKISEELKSISIDNVKTHLKSLNDPMVQKGLIDLSKSIANSVKNFEFSLNALPKIVKQGIQLIAESIRELVPLFVTLVKVYGFKLCTSVVTGYLTKSSEAAADVCFRFFQLGYEFNVFSKFMK